jgi:hypothetical protein
MALKKLPLIERLRIIETVVQEMRTELKIAPPLSMTARKQQMMAAAADLQADYLKDPDLAAFTALDSEDFHAAG